MLARSPSVAVVRILKELLPDRERYAEDLARVTTLARSTVYLILVRLEKQGVAASRTLDRRRWFRLTEKGRARAQEVVAAAERPADPVEEAL